MGTYNREWYWPELSLRIFSWQTTALNTLSCCSIKARLDSCFLLVFKLKFCKKRPWERFEKTVTEGMEQTCLSGISTLSKNCSKSNKDCCFILLERITEMFFGSFTLESDEKRQQKQNYTIFETFDLRHGRNVTEGKKFLLF